MTTTETTVSHCRNCHLKITFLGGLWTDPDGMTVCASGPAIPFDHDPVPDSDVADMIVPWTDSEGSLNVEPGDLIVHAGRFDMLSDVEVSLGSLGNGDLMVHVQVEGSWLPNCYPADHLVAVRRYVNEED